MISLSFFLLLLSLIEGQTGSPNETEIQGHTLYTLLQPGDIPAIFSPEYLLIPDANSFYYNDEPLIVVRSGKEVKGYSTWHLDQHEVVNDYIGGKAIVSTW